jgi:WD40 repeat protein
VFISYSREDRSYVERLAQHLRMANIPVWYDKDLSYGVNWMQAIEDQVDSCSAFVPIMSTSAAKRSCWVGRETLLAQQKGKRILPISRDGTVMFLLIDAHAEVVTDDAMPSDAFVAALRRDELPGGDTSKPTQTGYTHPAFLRSSKGHTAHVRAVAFSPDGSVIASGGEDEQVLVWDVATGEAIGTIRNDFAPAWPLIFIPTARRQLAVAAYNAPGVHIWDVDSGALVRSLAEDPRYGDEISTLAVTADGRLLATGDDDGAMLWNVASGESLGKLSSGRAAPRWPLSFSPDGTRLAIAHKGAATAGIWNLATRSLEHRLERHREYVTAGAYSPDGRLFVTGSADTTARIWDAGSGAQVGVLSGHTKAIWAVTFTGDGEFVVTASSDRSIRVWQAKTGELVDRLTGHTGGVYDLAISPDGSLLASGGGDGTVRIWSVSKATGAE